MLFIIYDEYKIFYRGSFSLNQIFKNVILHKSPQFSLSIIILVVFMIKWTQRMRQ